MARYKKTTEDMINEFLDVWSVKDMKGFMKDCIPLFELFHVDEKDDWVADQVGEDNKVNVRLIRMVYILSHFAEFHAAKLCRINIDFKDLWRRIEKDGKDECK